MDAIDLEEARQDIPGATHTELMRMAYELCDLAKSHSEALERERGERKAEREKLREAIQAIRKINQESQDCASGVKVHNPDGDGDEMCEEGICYENGWKDAMKIADEALALSAPMPQEEPKASMEWWCERCQSTKSPVQVKFDETCTLCGENVEWRKEPQEEPKK